MDLTLKFIKRIMIGNLKRSSRTHSSKMIRYLMWESKYLRNKIHIPMQILNNKKLRHLRCKLLIMQVRNNKRETKLRKSMILMSWMISWVETSRKKTKMEMVMREWWETLLVFWRSLNRRKRTLKRVRRNRNWIATKLISNCLKSLVLWVDMKARHSMTITWAPVCPHLLECNCNNIRGQNK